MRIVHVAILLALAAGCSNKKEGDKAAAPKDGEGAAAPAPTDTPPAAPAAPAAQAPAVTPEMLYAEQPVWEIQMLDRGLWVRSGSGAVEHKCRQELSMVVVLNGMLRTRAKAVAGATTCEAKAGLAVCTFKDPAPDPKQDPEGVTHWVFTGTDAAPILTAILTGPQDDVAAIAADLTKVEACPRPSDDPQ